MHKLFPTEIQWVSIKHSRSFIMNWWKKIKKNDQCVFTDHCERSKKIELKKILKGNTTWNIGSSGFLSHDLMILWLLLIKKGNIKCLKFF